MKEGAINKDNTEIKKKITKKFWWFLLMTQVLFNGFMAFFQISFNFVKIDGANFPWFI